VLPATDEEISAITEYVEWQAPDLKVTFCQKIYSESVLSHKHDIWDVHTTKNRWWVITNPTNLYSQDTFPNMDLAVTFHIGLMLRLPRSERPSIAEGGIEPFMKAFEAAAAAQDALGQAHKVSDYQTVGVRCREALLAFVAIAQIALPWEKKAEAPKKADFKGWVEHICSIVLAGESNKYRRQLFKTQADAAWTFVNWLTHARRPMPGIDGKAGYEITGATADESCRGFDNDHSGWLLTPGVEGLGRLAAMPQSPFGRMVVTTNFDPLIGASIAAHGGMRLSCPHSPRKPETMTL